MMTNEMRKLLEKHPRPEITLAELINGKLKTSITPARLRHFMRSNWNAVSLLAHVLHEKQRIADRRRALKPIDQ